MTFTNTYLLADPERVDPNEQRSLEQHRNVQSKIGPKEAGLIAQQQFSGNILNITENQHESGQAFYRVKLLLPSGHVKTVKIDATTGKLF